MKIKSCNSCGYSFSEGRGLCADWFCSERCREWYDNGNPAYNIKYISKSYDKKIHNPNLTLEEVALALMFPSKAVKKDHLEGKNGKVVVRSDGRNFWLVLDVSKRQISALRAKLSFMYEEDEKFFLYRLPTINEASAIRSAVGIKKRPALTLEILECLKNNLPTPSETPSSCGNMA